MLNTQHGFPKSVMPRASLAGLCYNHKSLYDMCGLGTWCSPLLSEGMSQCKSEAETHSRSGQLCGNVSRDLKPYRVCMLSVIQPLGGALGGISENRAALW